MILTELQFYLLYLDDVAVVVLMLLFLLFLSLFGSDFSLSDLFEFRKYHTCDISIICQRLAGRIKVDQLLLKYATIVAQLMRRKESSVDEVFNFSAMHVKFKLLFILRIWTLTIMPWRRSNDESWNIWQFDN